MQEVEQSDIDNGDDEMSLSSSGRVLMKEIAKIFVTIIVFVVVAYLLFMFLGSSLGLTGVFLFFLLFGSLLLILPGIILFLVIKAKTTKNAEPQDAQQAAPLRKVLFGILLISGGYLLLDFIQFSIRNM